MRRLSPEELEEEREILVRARQNRSAFGILYDRYFESIYSFALYQTGDRSRAEDITAATFTKALEELDRYEWRGLPYGAWLYRVASNLVARERRRPPWLELPEGRRADGDSPEQAWLAQESANDLRELLARLPGDQRQAVVMKFSGQMRNREIGEALGRSEGAVKQLLFRGMSSLRQMVLDRESGVTG